MAMDLSVIWEIIQQQTMIDCSNYHLPFMNLCSTGKKSPHQAEKYMQIPTLKKLIRQFSSLSQSRELYKMKRALVAYFSCPN